jgi:hypothetical protein
MISGYYGHGVGMGISTYHYDRVAPLHIKCKKMLIECWKFIAHPTRYVRFKSAMTLAQAKLDFDGIIRALILEQITEGEAQNRIQKLPEKLSTKQKQEFEQFIRSRIPDAPVETQNESPSGSDSPLDSCALHTTAQDKGGSFLEGSNEEIMSIRENRRELARLQKEFEGEASKYHDLTLTLFNIQNNLPIKNRKFHKNNHVISLCQYYGKLDSEESVQSLCDNIAKITDFGIKDAEFSSFAVIEGETTELFKKMAHRAGTLFTEKEMKEIRNKIQDDLLDKKDSGKQVFVVNSNPLAVWINYVLFHLSKYHPKRLGSTKLNVDPFTASLTAIDHLLETGIIEKGPNSLIALDDKRFKVALSFPGEKRAYVNEVADSLCELIDNESIFYDNYYTAELARPNLDLLLQQIYHVNSDLIVVFLCEEYDVKEWCGIEWRAIRDLVKRQEDHRIMFLRFDKAEVKGVFSIDGFIDLDRYSPKESAELIVERVNKLG